MVEFILEDITNNEIKTHKFDDNEFTNNIKFYWDNYNYDIDISLPIIKLIRENNDEKMIMEFEKDKNTTYIYNNYINNVKMTLNIYTKELFYDKNILVILYYIEETQNTYKITLKRS